MANTGNRDDDVGDYDEDLSWNVKIVDPCDLLCQLFYKTVNLRSLERHYFASFLVSVACALRASVFYRVKGFKQAQIRSTNHASAKIMVRPVKLCRKSAFNS